MIKWKLQEVLIKDLIQHEKNPRQISKDRYNKLSETIEKYGLIDKPIVNADLTIIGGHQRIKILKKNKVKAVECWVSETLLTQKQVDELCISLNLNQGSWDWDILADQWEPLDLLEWGFTENELVGSIKEAKKTLEPEKKDKKKCCPACGHEF